MTTSASAGSQVDPAYTREVEGRTQVNREGLADLCGLKVRTLKGRTGDEHFPPVVGRGPGRREWYDLDAARRFAAHVAAEHEEARPRLNPDLSEAEREALLDADGYLTPNALAVLLDREQVTVRSYISRSRPAWDRGEAGLLPIPDRREARGEAYEHLGWRLATIVDFERPGSVKGGRKPQS